MNDKNIILPTVTLDFFKKKKKVNCKALYDPASQLTFVTESMLNKLNYSVVQKQITLKINGFNESKVIKTKSVKLITKLNGKDRSFEALVVPTIRSSINSKELGPIIRCLSENGLAVADKDLATGGSDDVGILLGADYLHILPIQSCAFGADKKSLFYHTCQGIMLVGDVSVMKCNLKYIDLLNKFVNKINSDL